MSRRGSGSVSSSDPVEQIAAKTPVTTRALVIALIGIALLVAGAVAWAIVGRAPDTVKGHGVILPRGGYVEVGTVTEGVVDKVLVGPGAKVEQGTRIATVTVADGSTRPVLSTVTGQVIDVTARPGRRTTLGTPIAVLEPSTGGVLVKAFLPADTAEIVEPGMRALISPASAPQTQFGYMEGRVTSLAPATASRERLLTLLGDNESLVDFVVANGPVQEVTVEPIPASTPSGFEWTVGTGPPDPVTASTVAEVSVVIRDNSVISWIVR